MKKLSRATEKFLKPIDPSKLGAAILKVDIKHKRIEIPSPDDSSPPKEEYTPDKSTLVIEIFEEYEEINEGISQIARTSPSSWEATRFVESRFKHGFHKLNRRHIYHPIYEVPATDLSIYLILEAWTGQRQISPEASALISSLLIRDNSYEKCLSLVSQFKLNDLKLSPDIHTNPFLDLKSSLNPEAPELLPYQKVAATNAISVNSYNLFMDPGTGKTAVAIAKLDKVSLDTFSLANRPARILILCPKNVRQNWIKEIEKFSKTAYHIGILRGPGENVRNYVLMGLLAPGKLVHNTIVVTNYDAAVGTPLVTAVEWDLIILDESHLIASPTTNRTKFVLSLRQNSQHRMCLTGTPIRNVPFDLRPQLEFLGEGFSGTTSHAAFKEMFGVWKNIGYKGVRVLEEFQNIPLLQERLAKYCFIITKKEALPNLPEKTHDILECSLTKEQLDIYRQLASYLAAQINSIEVQDAITIRSHLTKLLRLAQITSGYAVMDEKGLYRFDPNPKLEVLVEMVKDHLEQNPDSKVLIWAYFNENIKQIAYRFNNVENIPAVSFYGGTSDADRITAEQRFNCDPSTPIFVGNPDAGGVGLNLLGFDPSNPDKYSTNADWSIYYSQNWSSVARRQSGDRNYRKGTRVPIRETDLIVPGSIDEVIMQRVTAKIDMALNIQDINNILTAIPTSNGD